MLSGLHSTFGPAVELLVFPSDEFGAQELPAADVPAFVQKKGLPVNAPGCRVMAKAQVNGATAHPAWLLAKQAFPGDVEWNFDAIFVFDKSGKCVRRTNLKDPPTKAQLRSML